MHPQALIDLADPRVRDRGAALFQGGEVTRLSLRDTLYRGRVCGSEVTAYRVDIDFEHGTWACTCPYEHGPVCKHAVAVALAVLEAPELIGPRPAGAGTFADLDGLGEDAVLDLLARLEGLYPELMREYAVTAARELEEEW